MKIFDYEKLFHEQKGKQKANRGHSIISSDLCICQWENGQGNYLSLFSSGLFMGRGLGELHWLVLAEAGAGLLMLGL